MEKFKKIFDEYVSKFEQTSKIKLKYEHTLRVADNCYNIASSLDLSDEDKKIAYLIGLCHDLGRFKQLALTDSFSDNKTNMNHAELSVNILFKESLINKFIDTMDYDELIKNAILSHNQDKIDKNLGERSKLFASILRDADKLDILNIITFENKENIFWFDEYHALEINDKVLNDHLNGKLVDYKDINTNFDLAIAYYNYALDINYKWTKDEILKNNYYKKITERFKTWFLKDHILETLETKSLEYLKKDN